MKFIVPSLSSRKTSMWLGIDLRETKRHHSKHSTQFHAPLHSMLYKLHTSMIRRYPLLIKEKSAVGRICKFRLPMGENSFKNDLLWKSILVIFSGERKSTSQVESSWLFPKQYPMHFPPLNRKKSNPSHEFAGDRKTLLAWWWCFRTGFDDIETNLRTNQSSDLFRVLPLIFLRLFSPLIYIFCL